jgi:hypothetical protein
VEFGLLLDLKADGLGDVSGSCQAGSVAFIPPNEPTASVEETLCRCPLYMTHCGLTARLMQSVFFPSCAPLGKLRRWAWADSANRNSAVTVYGSEVTV